MVYKFHGEPDMKIFVAAWLVVMGTALTSLYSCDASKPIQGCVAGQNEQCPDAGDWGVLKTFQDKYKAPKDEQDRVNGLWMRLQQTPPDGFHWDGTKMLYVKNPPPLVAPGK